MVAQLDALQLEDLGDGALPHRDAAHLPVDAELDLVLVQRRGQRHATDERERDATGRGRDQDLSHR